MTEAFNKEDGITLKEFVLDKIASLEKATAIALAANEKRLDSMNEIRGQMKDQTATYVTKATYDGFKETINNSIADLRESRAELKGRASQSSVTIGYILTIILFLINIVLKFVGN
jgi:SUMO ligase MMS21 Smc5/6 complex component